MKATYITTIWSINVDCSYENSLSKEGHIHGRNMEGG